MGKQVESVIGLILEKNREENKGTDSSILLIGRYNFDARNLCFSNDFIYDEQNSKIISKKYRYAKLEFLTAHSSKGLGYDNVIIVNARNGMYGFPSKVDNDPVMQYVVRDDKSIEYAEERRLFYVAMTRTKNRVYIVTPEQHPSEFILELIKDYPNIILRGEINKTSESNVETIKKCPVCGYPLQLRWKKNYGLRLWMCTNEPEICNFITNDLNGGDMSIEKCDKCKDGYLIVKKGNNGPVLGCTNYKTDGTGCDRLMSYDYYKRWLTEGFEEDTSVDKPSYQPLVVQEIPSVLPQKKRDLKTERKKGEVHTVEHTERYIEKDGFSVIVDNDGELITDMELLQYLRNVRTEIMKQENRPAYTIIGNKGLVSLATYSPTTKEEFMQLYGLGETSYNSYGQVFINAIKEYHSTHRR